MSLRLIRSPEELRHLIGEHRMAGHTIGFVPTMGGLHEGHLSLLKIARPKCDILVMSLFVNPTQFGPGEDLDQYPRSEPKDLAMATEQGVDIAFCPDAKAMYPMGFQTTISLPLLSTPLCGEGRPGHFQGMATVVAKLFNLVRPTLAVFGQKDAQQLAIIKQMVLDLDFGIDIIVAPIVREADGLAMSSRNVYLSEAQRKQALCLFRGLQAAKQCFAEGITDVAVLIAAVQSAVDTSPLAKLHYIQLRDALSLEEINTVKAPALLAIAANFGQTRLIDNVVLGRLRKDK